MVTRSLGLDIGDRRIGVALSDPDGVLASPLTIIERRGEALDLESIDRLIKEYEVGRVIVGLPVSMDGSLGPQAEKVQDFTEKLRAAIGASVKYRDERLTTVAAGRMLRQAAGKKRPKTRDDAAAAALILQGYLDEGK